MPRHIRIEQPANTHVRPRGTGRSGGVAGGLRPCLVIEHARFLPHCVPRIPLALENRLHRALRHCPLAPPFKADNIYRGMFRTKRYFRWLPSPLLALRPTRARASRQPNLFRGSDFLARETIRLAEGKDDKWRREKERDELRTLTNSDKSRSLDHAAGI